MDKRNKAMFNVAKIGLKILEVGHWVGEAIMLAAAICALVAPQLTGMFVGVDTTGKTAALSTYGFEIEAAVVGGQVETKAFVLFAFTAVILFGLMAMVFRNLYLIVKKSDGTTPFQKDNVRMLKEIGIFTISVFLVGFLMSIVARLVLGVDVAEINLRMDGLFMGIIVLCLTQYFAYGVNLQNDVDGLL